MILPDTVPDQTDWTIPPPAEEILWKGERGRTALAFVILALLGVATLAGFGSVSDELSAAHAWLLLLATLAGMAGCLAACARFARADISISTLRACRREGLFEPIQTEMVLTRISTVLVRRSLWQRAARLADLVIRAGNESIHLRSVENWETAILALQFIEVANGRELQRVRTTRSSQLYLSLPLFASARDNERERELALSSGRRSTFRGVVVSYIAPIAMAILAATVIFAYALLKQHYAPKPQPTSVVEQPADAPGDRYVTPWH